jgi:hypothetical protein
MVVALDSAFATIRSLLVRAGRLDSRVNDLTVVAAGVGAVVVQRIVVLAAGTDGAGELVRRMVICSATACLVLLALHFRRFIGAYLVSVGIGMNLLAMLLHGGLMPVSYESLQGHWDVQESQIGSPAHGSKDVVLHHGDIKLEVLADRYLIDAPGYGKNIYSLGDFVLFGGVVIAAVQGAVQVGTNLRRRASEEGLARSA